MCRRRCWENDWLIDLDVQKFFDEVPWSLVVKAVEAVTDARWVLLYVKRWLAAPLQHPDGTLQERDKGTPQGSAVSPILANLFMHYAFDAWMARSFPGCPFERYADDEVVHCVSRRQAEYVLAAISKRWPRSGYGSTPKRRGLSIARTATARAGTSTPRSPSSGSPSGHGRRSTARPERISPSFSARDQPRGAQGQKRRPPHDADPPAHRPDPGHLAAWLNPIVAGSINYYGRYYRSALHPLLRRVSFYLRRWLRRSTNGCGRTNGSNAGGSGCNNASPACSPVAVVRSY